jgi:DNA-binding FadR family transcriptional regulator
VQTQKRFQNLAEDLRNRIESGDIAVGEKLPTERSLAAEFQVSRTTVREALLSLEIAGLVDIRRGAGVFARGVASTGSETAEGAGTPSVFEIIDARLAFEPEVAAAAAGAARTADFEAMDAALAEMIREKDSGSQEELADRQFHLAVAEATGNQVMVNVVATLWDQARAVSWTRALYLVRTADRRDLWLSDHRRVMAAIRAGNRAEARKVMRAHLLHVRQVILTSEMGEV